MIAILTESFGGKWPFWLSPRQCSIVPVAPPFEEYARRVQRSIHDAGFACDFDADTGTTLPKKIRTAQLDQYNLIMVVGEEEAKNGTVNVRTRDNKVHGEFKLEEVLERLRRLKDSKTNNSEDFWVAFLSVPRPLLLVSLRSLYTFLQLFSPFNCRKWSFWFFLLLSGAWSSAVRRFVFFFFDTLDLFAPFCVMRFDNDNPHTNTQSPASSHGHVTFSSPKTVQKTIRTWRPRQLREKTYFEMVLSWLIAWLVLSIRISSQLWIDWLIE